MITALSLVDGTSGRSPDAHERLGHGVVATAAVRRVRVEIHAAKLAALASTLLGSIDDDAEAYRGVIDAHKLPNDAPTRDRAIQDALVHAVEVPERAADCAAEALRVLAPLEPLIYPLVASDLQVGVELLRSCLRGAVANMRANLGGVLDPAVRARHEARIAALESSLREPGSAPPDAAG
jgi:formiminotetrahydrofolate cyclodeaminase